MSYDNDSWRSRAACRTQPTDPFFVKEYKREVVADLKELCSHCPVQQECLAFADEFEGASYKDTWGIYGGLTARERIERRAARMVKTPNCRRVSFRAWDRHVAKNEPPCELCAGWRARREADQVRWAEARAMVKQGGGIKETCLALGLHHKTLKRLLSEAEAPSL